MNTLLVLEICAMGYGIVQGFRMQDEFWFTPIGNIVGGIALAVVGSAAFRLRLQDSALLVIALSLGLYWFTRSKQTATRPSATKQTYNQTFQAAKPAVKVEPVVEDEPAVETKGFTWTGA